MSWMSQACRRESLPSSRHTASCAPLLRSLRRRAESGAYIVAVTVAVLSYGCWQHACLSYCLAINHRGFKGLRLESFSAKSLSKELPSVRDDLAHSTTVLKTLLYAIVLSPLVTKESLTLQLSGRLASPTTSATVI